VHQPITATACPQQVRRFGRFRNPHFRKNVAKLPAIAVMTKMPQASRATSTTLPAVVTGFGIEEDTVNNCTAVKNAESPRPWMSLPFTPLSVSQTRPVPMTNTSEVKQAASSSRATRRR